MSSKQQIHLYHRKIWYKPENTRFFQSKIISDRFFKYSKPSTYVFPTIAPFPIDPFENAILPHNHQTHHIRHDHHSRPPPKLRLPTPSKVDYRLITKTKCIVVSENHVQLKFHHRWRPARVGISRRSDDDHLQSRFAVGIRPGTGPVLHLRIWVFVHLRVISGRRSEINSEVSLLSDDCDVRVCVSVELGCCCVGLCVNPLDLFDVCCAYIGWSFSVFWFVFETVSLRVAVVWEWCHLFNDISLDS